MASQEAAGATIEYKPSTDTPLHKRAQNATERLVPAFAQKKRGMCHFVIQPLKFVDYPLFAGAAMMPAAIRASSRALNPASSMLPALMPTWRNEVHAICDTLFINAAKFVCNWEPSFAAYLAKKRADGKHYNVAISHAAKKARKCHLLLAEIRAALPNSSLTISLSIVTGFSQLMLYLMRTNRFVYNNLQIANPVIYYLQLFF